jgi:hypothetical protein
MKRDENLEVEKGLFRMCSKPLWKSDRQTVVSKIDNAASPFLRSTNPERSFHFSTFFAFRRFDSLLRQDSAPGPFGF